ncbi:MAG: fibronectin type III domain-containing protein [Acidimicrobiales bacterium]
MMRQPNPVKRTVCVGLPIVLALAAAAASGAAAQPAPQDRIPFAETKIIIELNATDLDAGIQVFLDGEGWERVKVFRPDGGKIMDITAQRAVRHVGVTELFFESAEPSLEDLPLEDLLAMFPEGDYQFEGRTVQGDTLFGTAGLTHAIPSGPVVTSPDPDVPTDPGSTVVAWEPVTDPPGIEIAGYQVIVELEDPLRVFSVDLPATATSLTVSPEFLAPGTHYMFEVLAISDGGNQTITEGEFDTAA